MFNFDSQFFDAHQKLLLWIANHKISRWILGLNRLPKPIKARHFDKIDVASVHWKVKDGWQAACFTRPRFGEALAYNLSPFAYLQPARQWRFSPIGVLGMFLGALLTHGFYFAGTTTSYYTGAGDGYCLINNQATWADTHDAASSQSADYTGTITEAYNGKNSSGNYYIIRAYFPTDTSGIGAGNIVSAASFYGMIDYKYTSYNDAYRYVALTGPCTQADMTKVVVSDYSKCGTTKWSANFDPNSSPPTIGSYLQMDFNAAGIAGVQITGYTAFNALGGNDIDNVAYAGNNNTANGLDFRTSEYTGSSSDPYLSVTYATATVVSITANTGYFNLTGIDAALSKFEIYTLNVTKGVFVLIGRSVNFLYKVFKWSFDSKNSSNWTFDSKNSSNWTNEDKINPEY